MAQRPFRFVHAADLLLDEPLHGLTEIPEGLQSKFITAPREAAENVFDTALNEQAMCLVLSGNVLDLEETDAATLDFLCRQFERLNREKIGVYWAGGPIDPPLAWPHGLQLPANVHCFPVDRLEEVLLRLDGEPLCKLMGHSHRLGADVDWGLFEQMAAGPFSIAVLHTRTTLKDHVQGHVDYWALGGRNKHSQEEGSRGMAAYSGTPQGRRPQDIGPHGCLVVNVTAEGRCVTRLQPTDVLRWRKETIPLSAKHSPQEAEQRVKERWKAVIEEPGTAEQLVVFEFTGEGAVLDQIRRTGLAKPWLDRLRKENGGKSKAHPVNIETPPLTQWPTALLERRTMVGDFLREITAAAEQNEIPFDLWEEAQGLEELQLPPEWIRAEDPKRRARLLAETARLGADLLLSEESNP